MYLRNWNVIHSFRWFSDAFSADVSSNMRVEESFEAWQQQTWWWVLLDDIHRPLVITPGNLVTSILAPSKCRYWTIWLPTNYLMCPPLPLNKNPSVSQSNEYFLLRGDEFGPCNRISWGSWDLGNLTTGHTCPRKLYFKKICRCMGHWDI